MAAYATVTDLASYISGEPPPESDRLLQRASDLLDAVLVTSVYAVDSSGNATDALVIAGLRDACCAQVEWWISSGDELNELGQWQATVIEGVALTRWNDKVGQDRLAPRAMDMLRVAGLKPSSGGIQV